MHSMIGAVKYVVDRRTAMYNKAMDEVRTREASEYFNQLKGMQEVLKAVGIQMGMDKGSHTGWNLVCSVEG